MHSNSTPKIIYRLRSFGDLGQRLLVSCLSTFSKDISSETTGPISFKFPMQPSGIGGKKVYIFGPGYLTKMAPMHIYSKNLQKKSTTTEPIG